MKDNNNIISNINIKNPKIIITNNNIEEGAYDEDPLSFMDENIGVLSPLKIAAVPPRIETSPYKPPSEATFGSATLKRRKYSSSSLSRHRLSQSCNSLQIKEIKEHESLLPVCSSSSDVKCVKGSTLRHLIASDRFQGLYEKVIIIDCRFHYEYKGGHIKGAVNISSTKGVEKRLIANLNLLHSRLCLVFHCEFSSHRGPALYRYLRRWDRNVHANNYPQLYYPEMYVLKGGYKEFYEKFAELCDPKGYVPMRERKFANQMKNCMMMSTRATVTRCRSFRGNDQQVANEDMMLYGCQFGKFDDKLKQKRQVKGKEKENNKENEKPKGPSSRTRGKTKKMRWETDRKDAPPDHLFSYNSQPDLVNVSDWLFNLSLNKKN